MHINKVYNSRGWLTRPSCDQLDSLSVFRKTVFPGMLLSRGKGSDCSLASQSCIHVRPNSSRLLGNCGSVIALESRQRNLRNMPTKRMDDPTTAVWPKETQSPLTYEWNDSSTRLVCVAPWRVLRAACTTEHLIRVSCASLASFSYRRSRPLVLGNRALV